MKKMKTIMSIALISAVEPNSDLDLGFKFVHYSEERLNERET